jgi:hypothetical protein
MSSPQLHDIAPMLAEVFDDRVSACLHLGRASQCRSPASDAMLSELRASLEGEDMDCLALVFRYCEAHRFLASLLA